jgi:hypothetical protein
MVVAANRIRKESRTRISSAVEALHWTYTVTSSHYIHHRMRCVCAHRIRYLKAPMMPKLTAAQREYILDMINNGSRQDH